MAQIEHKDVGDIWRPKATFTINDVGVDPTLLTIRVQSPDGTETETVESSPDSLGPSSTPVSRPAVGQYVFRVPLDAAGHWYCRFEGTGTATAAEDFEVIADPSPFFAESGVATRALVTLGETKDWLGIRQVDTTRDGKIVQRINAASKRIMEVAGREFKPVTAGLSERSFDVFYSDCRAGTKAIGDMATATSSSATFTDLHTGSVVMTMSGNDYVTLPRNRAADEPITSIRLLSTASGFSPGNVFNITAFWGFPSVPEDVKHATMDTVAFWLDRDVEHFRQDLGAVPGASEGGQTVIVGSAPTVLPLPPEAFSIAKSYKSTLVV